MTPTNYDLYSDSGDAKKGLGITSIVFAIISFVALIILVVFYLVPTITFLSEDINLYLFYGFNGLSLIGIILGLSGFKANLPKIGFFLNLVAFAGLGVFSVIFSLMFFVTGL